MSQDAVSLSQNSLNEDVKRFIAETLGDNKGSTHFELGECVFDDRTIKICHTIKGIEVDMESLDKDNTGMKIWPVAREFCGFIQSHHTLFRDKIVCELGAGTALCGLYASFLCKEIVITDGDPTIIPIIQKNIELNDCRNASSHQLNWGDRESMRRIKEKHPVFEVVIGSEILYHESHASGLIDTVNELLRENGGMFIMAIAVRIRSTLTTLSWLAQRSNWEVIPVDFQLSNNSRTANFSFKTLLMWKVPPSTVSNLDSRANSMKEEEEIEIFGCPPIEEDE